MELGLRDATYLYALGELRGVGQRGLLQIVKIFPEPDALIHASSHEVEQKLDQKLAQTLLPILRSKWSTVWKSAEEAIRLHMQHAVTPIPITDAAYPPLLTLIPDPPAILYAKGKISILRQTDTVAIVGTRGPTEVGKRIAHQVARDFSKAGYVVVSGLAKGIDTAAHQGAIAAGGATIAVLGTALDKIYPAENRSLAERIASDFGVLLSEFPLGRSGFKTAFIQRDRIQSGLSLAVIPVQTDLTGGTMHTVKFAEEHGRLLFCPKPVDSEAKVRQYAGILFLIRSGRAQEFRANGYARIFAKLQEQKERLLADASRGLQLPRTGDVKASLQGGLGFAETDL